MRAVYSRAVTSCKGTMDNITETYTPRTTTGTVKNTELVTTAVPTTKQTPADCPGEGGCLLYKALTFTLGAMVIVLAVSGAICLLKKKLQCKRRRKKARNRTDSYFDSGSFDSTPTGTMTDGAAQANKPKKHEPQRKSSHIYESIGQSVRLKQAGIDPEKGVRMLRKSKAERVLGITPEDIRESAISGGYKTMIKPEAVLAAGTAAHAVLTAPLMISDETYSREFSTLPLASRMMYNDQWNSLPSSGFNDIYSGGFTRRASVLMRDDLGSHTNSMIYPRSSHGSQHDTGRSSTMGPTHFLETGGEFALYNEQGKTTQILAPDLPTKIRKSLFGDAIYERIDRPTHFSAQFGLNTNSWCQRTSQFYCSMSNAKVDSDDGIYDTPQALLSSHTTPSPVQEQTNDLPTTESQRGSQGFLLLPPKKVTRGNSPTPSAGTNRSSASSQRYQSETVQPSNETESPGQPSKEDIDSIYDVAPKPMQRLLPGQRPPRSPIRSGFNSYVETANPRVSELATKPPVQQRVSELVTKPQHFGLNEMCDVIDVEKHCLEQDREQLYDTPLRPSRGDVTPSYLQPRVVEDPDALYDVIKPSSGASVGPKPLPPLPSGGDNYLPEVNPPLNSDTSPVDGDTVLYDTLSSAMGGRVVASFQVTAVQDHGVPK